MEAKAIHERWHRWPLRLTAVFSLLFLACCCLAVAALICAFIPPARSASIPLLLMAVVSLMLSVIFYKIGNRVEEKVENLSSQLNEYANRLKQMQYGLRAPNECDNPVPPTEWTPRMSECAEWAFGEQEMVLPSDTVVKFGWYDGATSGQGGYGIKREDKIVAEYITWRS